MAGVVIASLAGVASCTSSKSDEPVAPLVDPGLALEACLHDRGWSDATAHPDGSIQIDIPNEQRGQFDADINDCSDKIGLNDLPETRTREQAEKLYDALLEAAECVRGLGYHVDDPPSRQAAVEAMMQPTIDLGGWDPYQGPIAAAQSQEDVNDVYTKCPSPWLKP